MGYLNGLLAALGLVVLLLVILIVRLLSILGEEEELYATANTPELLGLLEEMQKMTGTDNEVIRLCRAVYIDGFCQTALYKEFNGHRFYQIEFDSRFLDLSRSHQAAVLAHELGHVKLGHFSPYLSREASEREVREAEADIFAEDHVGVDVYWAAYSMAAEPLNVIIRKATAKLLRRQINDWLHNIHGEV